MQLRHHRGLDGLRGFAVLAVVLYHGGVSWAQGGFLGVEAFFVLSGFLITSLLLAEWAERQTISLRAFWARRARRLLPALLGVVSVIGLYYAFGGPEIAVPGLTGDGLSTLLYVGNWHQIAAGGSYFAATGPVSPLTHTWSLAIEEQFYLLWPLLVLGVLWLMQHLIVLRPAQPRQMLRTLLVLTLAGVAGSALESLLLLHGGHGLNRVYYGTDTRAASLLMGASLAIGLALLRARAVSRPRPSAAVVRRRERLGSVSSVLALLALVSLIEFAGGSSLWLYPFGLLGLDAAVLLVIVAVVCSPRTIVARTLSFAPLRGLGKISYGVYLWHFPLFLWLDSTSTGLSGTGLLLFRCAVTLAISLASYILIEQPIRRRRMPRRLLRALTPMAAAGAALSLLLASSFGSLALGGASAAALPLPAKQLQGTDPGCTVALRDTRDYGLAPPPAPTAAKYETTALGDHRIRSSGSGSLTFHTCPPKKVLVVGDSIAFTLGVGMMENEQRYGVELANGGTLGCGFTTVGQVEVAGAWESQSAGCPNALTRWASDEHSLHADAVIVELGYRDEFDWRSNGHVMHLGEAGYDRDLQHQIDRYVQVLSAHGVKLLLLSVPFSDPTAEPDGSPAPAASPARHALINSMLARAVRGHSNARLENIDSVVSPGGHYDTTVNGHLCRFDGVHFTFYCSQLLEPAVLSEVRRMVGS